MTNPFTTTGFNIENLSDNTTLYMEQETAVSRAREKRMRDERHQDYPLLDIPPIRPKRRVNMPTFRLEFDNVSDISRRLKNTAVYIGGELFFVVAIHDEDKEFVLYLSDGKSQKSRIAYNSKEINLRAPEPRYITSPKLGVLYCYRIPVREQQQGLSRTNTVLKEIIGGTKRRPDDMLHLIRCLNNNKTISWDEKYFELMRNEIIHNMRLNNSIAVAASEDKILAEYKGRFLGNIRDDVVLMSDTDFDCPWIRQELSSVNLKAKTSKE